MDGKIEVQGQLETEIVPNSVVDVQTDNVQDTQIAPNDNELELSVSKKEYTLINDGLYTGVNSEETPQWLNDLLDTAIKGLIGTNLLKLNEAIDSINTSLLELEVAKNQYQELINIEQTVEGVVASKIETLNATVKNNSANIISIDAAKVTADEASALSIDHINSSIEDGKIHSLVTHLDKTIARGDSTNAASITSLNSEYEGNKSTVNETLLTQANAISTNASAITDLNSEYEDNKAIVSSILTSSAGEMSANSNAITDLAANTSDAAATATQNLSVEVGVLKKDNGNTYYYNQDSTLVIDGAAVYPTNAQIAANNGGLTGGIDGFQYTVNGTSHPVATSEAKYKDLNDGNGKRWYYNSGTDASPTWEVLTIVYKDWAPSDGDILVLTYKVDNTDIEGIYQYKDSKWGPSDGTSIGAKSEWNVDLKSYLKDPAKYSGDTFGGTSSVYSRLQTESAARSQDKKDIEASIDKVTSTYGFRSELSATDGSRYITGIDLTSNIVEDGNASNAATSSQFTVQAEKFKLVSPGTVDNDGNIVEKDTSVEVDQDGIYFRKNDRIYKYMQFITLDVVPIGQVHTVADTFATNDMPDIILYPADIPTYFSGNSSQDQTLVFKATNKQMTKNAATGLYSLSYTPKVSLVLTDGLTSGSMSDVSSTVKNTTLHSESIQLDKLESLIMSFKVHSLWYSGDTATSYYSRKCTVSIQSSTDNGNTDAWSDLVSKEYKLDSAAYCASGRSGQLQLDSTNENTYYRLQFIYDSLSTTVGSDNYTYGSAQDVTKVFTINVPAKESSLTHSSKRGGFSTDTWTVYSFEHNCYALADMPLNYYNHTTVDITLEWKPDTYNSNYSTVTESTEDFYDNSSINYSTNSILYTIVKHRLIHNNNSLRATIQDLNWDYSDTLLLTGSSYRLTMTVGGITTRTKNTSGKLTEGNSATGISYSAHLSGTNANGDELTQAGNVNALIIGV